jgi:hypothetical protein
MKQTKPNVYATAFSLSGVKLDVVARRIGDAGHAERRRGATRCKWNAVAP